MARDAENEVPGIVPEDQEGEPTQNWDAKRTTDLRAQFGDKGVVEIDKLSFKYSDPDDAVREYRRQLRARGEGEPV